MNRIRKIQELSWDERWLLVEATLFLPLTALAVYSVGVGRWQRTLTRLTSLRVASASDCNVATVKSTDKSVAADDRQAAIQKARVIAKIVRIAARRGIYHANCLEQSLVLWWLLALRNIESELRFGARKENAQLEAHAWVVYCGVSLNEETDVHERFSPFETVTAAARGTIT
ncbi:MAG: lasso peptide biosynthesis B2 protein [Pyrinomonadaceae bacterium]|nr:lasso peptide biosynthesis B2 protein [Pyrinomonadaceae bacterium]